MENRKLELNTKAALKDLNDFQTSAESIVNDLILEIERMEDEIQAQSTKISELIEEINDFKNQISSL